MSWEEYGKELYLDTEETPSYFRKKMRGLKGNRSKPQRKNENGDGKWLFPEQT